MKEKILWIIAALIFFVGYPLLNIFPPADYQNQNLTWVINLFVLLVFTGPAMFLLTAIVALVPSGTKSYTERFIRALPFFVIFLGILLIFGTLGNAALI